MKRLINRRSSPSYRTICSVIETKGELENENTKNEKREKGK
jgi:hypothetical protein